MEDIFKSKEKEFYIKLKQERYFFPGEDISGDIIYNVTKSTKVTNIKVVLSGTVEIGGRSMQLFSKDVTIAKPDNGDKYSLLESQTHQFPFTITIPTSKDCKVPSTLEINKLLKISYQVTAILNKPFSFMEKLNASTIKSINILEDINVESEEYLGELKKESKVYLTGEHRPVTVTTVIGKRAAVKGDTIPISINIEHIGVMVRDKAISVKLLRSVYYGKNKNELFGPKVMREVTANIEIAGPISFTKLFNLKLAIPTNLCPTVQKSADAFRIEYTLQVIVNLNEENPHRPDVPQNFSIFNFPFTIGTYPKVSFNIDDDDEEEEIASQLDPLVEDETSNNSSEYDQVVERMKEMELEATPSQMMQEANKPPKTGYTPLQALTASPPESIQYLPPKIIQEVKPLEIKKDILFKPNEIMSPSIEPVSQIPSMISTEPTPLVKKSPESTTPLERLPSNGSIISPKMDFATNVGGNSESSSSVKAFNSNYQPVTTSPPFEHNTVPLSPSYRTKHNITPSDVYNPTLSPSLSSQTMNNTPSVHSIEPNPLVGRQKSFHWVAPPVAPVSVTPVSVTPNFPPTVNINSNPPSPVTIAPVLPPRPTFSLSNQTNTNLHGGISFPQPEPNYSLHQPLSFPGNNNYNQHYSGTSYSQHQPAYNGVAFPQAQVNHYNQNVTYPPQYNNNNYHYQQNGYPYPPQPQTFMDMPSHQDYQPQPNYSYYPN